MKDKKSTDKSSITNNHIKAIKNKFKNYFKNKRKRRGAISTSIAVLAIIITILINMGASALDNKYSLSLDLTKNHSFKLTDQSKDFIKNIDKDITITVLSNEEKFTANGDYFVQANSVINDYDKNSNKIEVKYVDLDDNPTYVNNYPNEKLNANSIVVSCGERYKVVTVQDLFNIQSSYYGAVITASEAEQAMTSAIMYVLNDNPTKISIISGYGESDSSAFVSLLIKNNYEVTDIDIVSQDIPTDSAMAILFAPDRDYDSEGISKLEKYLNNDGNFGKNLFVVLNPQNSNQENLNKFLESWNIKVSDGLVFDVNSKNLLVSGSPYYAKHEYVDEEFATGVSNKNIAISIPFAKPLEILDTNNVRTLLQSSETSGVRPNSADENWEPEDSDINGPIPSMVLSNKSNEAGNNSSVTVVASETAFDPQILSRTALNNSSYFINSVNIITNREDTGITIESKTITGDELSITAFQVTVISAIFVIIIPLAILITGLIIWIRRKNL